MRAVAVHPDALVLTSRIWQTTATALRAGGECMLVDSPYFPDELEALPGVLAAAGFEPNALLATHADFDHLLARLAFPELSLGVGEPSLLRLRAEPGAAQRELREHDTRFYVERERPLGLGQVQSLPLPGKLELGDQELELHPAEGHTADGLALFAPSHGVLCCGDYLSPVEIPMISPGGSLADYRETLERLAGLAGRAGTVIPGHGRPLTRVEAQRIAEEDAAYLDALEGGRAAPPPGRDTAEQLRIHEENLKQLA